MHKRGSLLNMLVALALVVWTGFITPLRAQESSLAAEAAPDAASQDVFKNLSFRNLGPAAAGGRVTAVVGVPDNPALYYVGAAAGGVFKTVDGGLSWKAVFEHEKTASIGDIALAPSNPNLIWVGTGEGNVRNDVIDGAGVYLSADAGQSW